VLLSVLGRMIYIYIYTVYRCSLLVLVCKCRRCFDVACIEFACALVYFARCVQSVDKTQGGTIVKDASHCSVSDDGSLMATTLNKKRTPPATQRTVPVSR